MQKSELSEFVGSWELLIGLGSTVLGLSIYDLENHSSGHEPNVWVFTVLPQSAKLKPSFCFMDILAFREFELLAEIIGLF